MYVISTRERTTKLIYSYLVFFSLCGVFVTPENAPSITSMTGDQTGISGNSVEFKCHTRNASNYTQIWEKVSSDEAPGEIISKNNRVIANDARFMVKADSSNSVFTLTINDVKISDAARYKCVVVISENEEISVESWLHIKSPPTFLDQTTKISVRENDIVTINCSVSGYPKPKVIIQRKDNVNFTSKSYFHHDGDILVINKITEEDSARYICYADNLIGVSLTKEVLVDVLFPPVIQTLRVDVQYEPKFTATFECFVKGHPAPEITWFKDGVQLSDDTAYRINNNTFDGGVSSGTLKFTSQTSEYGIYSFQASNKIGEFRKSVEFPNPNETPSECSSPSWFIFAISILIIVGIIVGGVVCYCIKGRWVEYTL